MPVAVRAEGQRRRGPCGGGVARAEAARRAWRRRGACGVLKRSGAEQRRLRRPGRPDPNRRAGGASCACPAMAAATAVFRIRAPAPERRALGPAGPGWAGLAGGPGDGQRRGEGRIWARDAGRGSDAQQKQPVPTRPSRLLLPSSPQRQRWRRRRRCCASGGAAESYYRHPQA